MELALFHLHTLITSIQYSDPAHLSPVTKINSLFLGLSLCTGSSAPQLFHNICFTADFE